jgi:SAM-dependent methyltransferase
LVLLAAVPSSLLLGVTTYITTDIASVPLFWVLPLAIYLLTFIIAFSPRSPLTPKRSGQALAVLSVPLALAYLEVLSPPIAVLLPLHLGALFFAAMFAHGTLAARRPPADRLTEFYLLLSLGGVIGGSLTALVAPVIFDDVVEYPLAIVLALLLRHMFREPSKAAAATVEPASHRPSLAARYAWTLDFFLPLVFVFGLLLLVGVGGLVLPNSALKPAIAIGSCAVLLAWWRRPRRFAFSIAMIFVVALFGAQANVVHQERTFFGVLRVTDESGKWRTLKHGTTLHGVESLRPSDRGEPLSYYARSGPAGAIFEKLQQPRAFRDVGVVGLGVGTLAAYGQEGQRFDYFDIDPAMIAIARDDHLFSFLSRSHATVRTIAGDGRLQLAKEPDAKYDLLVLDAYSSDSVPMHLITRESMALYRDKVKADGVIAYHISSRHLRLQPVLARQAESLGLQGKSRVDFDVAASELDRGVSPSHWVVFARSPRLLRALRARAGWRVMRASASTPLWTDDFSNVLDVIDWS